MTLYSGVSEVYFVTLTGKYNRSDYLVDPIVDLMITCNIMVYCIQETWVVGTGSKLVRDHMVFIHNR